MGLISVRPGDPGGPKVLGTPSIGITRVFDSMLQAGCTSAVELLEMRIVLDSSAAAFASTSVKSKQVKLVEIFEQMQETTELHRFAGLDAKFHEAVIVASGNRLFHLVYQALIEPIGSLIENSLRSSPKHGREKTLEQHAAIVEAIRAGDSQGAVKAVRKHLGEFYIPFLSVSDKQRLNSFLKAIEK
jgi:DNA-binding FadR family transcriptional regulator